MVVDGRWTVVSLIQTGVLDGSSGDFDTHDDVYDAVGGFLHEADCDKDEDDVIRICKKLYKTLRM